MRFGGKNLCPSDRRHVHLSFPPPPLLLLLLLVRLPRPMMISGTQNSFPCSGSEVLIINQGERLHFPSQKIPLLDFNAFMNVHLLSLAQIHRAGAFKKRHLILPGKLPLPWVCWGDVLVLSFGHIASHHVRGHSVGWRVPTGQSSTRWAWKP